MLKRNQTSDLFLQEASVLEYREDCNAQKKILLDTTTPRKYGALIKASQLDFQVVTQCDGGQLDLVLLCPIADEKPVSVNVFLNLKHSDCQLRVHLIALVKAQAKTSLKATIFMEPKLQNTGCHLLEETVVLAPEVSLESVPILDIHAKNIQASHGAKIYRLDEEKLFYLQTKGLARRAAEQLLLASYGERLMDDIPLTEEEKSELMSDFLAFVGKE